MVSISADATTVDEIQSRVKVWAESNPDGRWIVGRGWRVGALATTPTRQLLDAAISDRPVCLFSDDGRAAWLNTRALQSAGITRRSAVPADGAIVKDPRAGTPSGVLKGSAVALVTKVMPRPSHDERARGLRDAVEEAHRNGVTSIQDTIQHADDFLLVR